MQDLKLDYKVLELQNSFQFSPAAPTGRGWELHVVTITWEEQRPGLYVQHEEITTWEMKQGISEEKYYVYYWW